LFARPTGVVLPKTARLGDRWSRRSHEARPQHSISWSESLQAVRPRRRCSLGRSDDPARELVIGCSGRPDGGQTTCWRLIAVLSKPDRAKVDLPGATDHTPCATGIDACRRRGSIINPVSPHLTVAGNVRSRSKVLGRARAEIEAASSARSLSVQLAHRGKRRIFAARPRHNARRTGARHPRSAVEPDCVLLVRLSALGS